MKRASCRDRLEQALARIADPKGEGARACLTVYAEAARATADAADARAARGTSLGPFDGTIVSIKDLFDVAGEPTRAGSKVLAEEAAPAKADATVVQRLRHRLQFLDSFVQLCRSSVRGRSRIVELVREPGGHSAE